jgi:hypothetical protein
MIDEDESLENDLALYSSGEALSPNHHATILKRDSINETLSHLDRQ